MNASIPYLGYRISLLSNSDIRYEGTLSGIDSNEATVTLRNVRSMGTEGRAPHREILPSPEIYDCIVFRGQNIKDITVCGNDFPIDIYQDPAIISAKPIVNGNEESKIESNTQNFYFGQNEDSKIKSKINAWDEVYNKPAYTAKDLIDKSVNDKGDYKLEGKNEGKSKESQRKKNNFKRNSSESKIKNPKVDETLEKNKIEFKDEFDFEQANSVFVKEQRAVSSTYKHSNFFDNISSDIHEVNDRNTQKKLDMDTFGESAQNYRPYRYNQGGKSRKNYRNYKKK